MKKIIYITILCVAVMISGCEKESYGAFSETQVDVKKAGVTFTAKGGTGTIEVEDSSLPLTATSDQSWCSVSVSGGIVTVTVEPNISMLSRTALITLKSGEKTNYVPVSQSAVYLSLKDYETITFLGNGGVISFPFECSVQVPVTVVCDDPWLTSSISGDTITLTAQTNPDFLNGRSSKVKIIAGNNLATVLLDIYQGELITSYEPDPNVNTVNDFLNLKNNNGTSSRYKIVYFSPRLATLYNNLKAAYPILQEMRIEAPRSSYKISVILYNLSEGTASYYYWNATDGFVPVDGSKSVAAFIFSGNSYSGTTAPYTSNANYTSLRTCFASLEGFTVIPDEAGTFWFRSVANPLDYFKVEAASW